MYMCVTVVSSVTDVHIHTHHTAVVTKLTWRYTHMVVQNDIIALDGTAERERERERGGKYTLYSGLSQPGRRPEECVSLP